MTQKKLLRNVLLIVAPGRCCQRYGNDYHLVAGCRACGRGPTREGRELGETRENSADFDLKRISKLNTI
jgi:hypothetical protein